MVIMSVDTDKPPAPTSEIGYASSTGTTPSWWNPAETIPDLRWPCSAWTYERMRNDPQVASVLQALTLPVLRAGRWLNPNGADPDAVEALSQDLGVPVKGAEDKPIRRTPDRFSFDEHLEHALLALIFGFMPFEPQYRFDDPSGWWRLRKLAPRMPVTISRIQVARDGGLEWIEQRGTERHIPVDKLVMYTHQREAGNWYGRSVLRSAWAPWMLKQKVMHADATGAIRNAHGIPVYTGAAGGSKEDLDKGFEMAKAWRAGNEAAASLPGAPDPEHPQGAAKLELVGGQELSTHLITRIRLYNEEIGRSCLQQFLNLGGDNSTGSYALGDTFADFFVQSLQTKANWFRGVFNQHVIEDWFDYNVGRDAPAPILEFDEIGLNTLVLAQVMSLLTKSGVLFMDPATEDNIRRQIRQPPKSTPTTTPGGTG